MLMQRFWEVFRPFIDLLLPEEVLNKRRNELFQARLVTAVLVLVLPLSLLLFSIDFIRGAYEYAAITAGFASFCILSLWFLKRTGRYQLIAVISNTIPVITLTRAALQEGGLDSMYIPVLLVVPSIAFITSKRQGGVLITGFTLSALTLLLIFNPEGVLLISQYVILVVSLIFWTVCVLTFYTLNHAALKKVESANRKLEILNQRLEDRSEHLREALEVNKEILGITAHDLKNPLGGIIGLADMVLLDYEENPVAASDSARENLPILKAEAERMLQIVKELLDKHREGEKTALKKERIILNDIIATVYRWNDVQAKNKDIGLHFGTSTIATVDVDVVAIQRVVDNYISNAIKYSPLGANVWIELSVSGFERNQEGLPMVKISVIDEGPGLTAEDKSKVFGKLQRLSAKPTAGEHSTGLGLFIAKSLIEAHGGDVGVDSQPGQGAKFWFTLPMSPLTEEKTPVFVRDELPLHLS